MMERTSTSRSICPRCQRPIQGGCICGALPDAPLRLRQCHCLILQHPHERRRKNRSLPFVEMCLSTDSLTIAVARRLGRTQLDEASHFQERLTDSSHTNLWLIYPCEEAVSLEQAVKDWKDEQLLQETRSTVVLLLLDATWKFAKEMDASNRTRNLYPSHMKRVQLTENDLQTLSKPKRFDIRTPPSEQHLSTAETLALVVSKVENDETIYETLMKPLDLMVEQWHSFQESKKPQTPA
ncbi:hypothetical protein ACA910_016494 [Epithemia clementina (nom. ined.)]